jgi:hypothetical protein
MRWDKKNKVFRPGDYELDLKWFTGRDPVSTLIQFSQQLTHTNPELEWIKHEKQPFQWNEPNLQALIYSTAETMELLRKENPAVNRLLLAFNSSVEGIDLLVGIWFLDNQPPTLVSLTLDFTEENIMLNDSKLSSPALRRLFLDFVQSLNPEYAVIRRQPPITDTWYQEVRVSIDTTKIPVTLEWINYFSWDWVRRLGEKQFERVREGEVKWLSNGIIYEIQAEPFSYTNAEHVARQKWANAHFELNKLYRKYPRR